VTRNSLIACAPPSAALSFTRRAFCLTSSERVVQVRTGRKDLCLFDLTACLFKVVVLSSPYLLTVATRFELFKMGKTRVGVLFRESMGGNKSSNKSADLASLTSKYNGFCKKIRSLIESLKSHHNAMVKMEESRLNVSPFNKYSAMTAAAAASQQQQQRFVVSRK